MNLTSGTPALTICQPWAWAIVFAGKDIENRTWPTGYRGPLVIHAGKSREWHGSLRPSDYPGCPELPPETAFTYGAFVAVAEVFDCVRAQGQRDQLGPWAEGPWCWRLRNVTPLEEPIPRSGAQGMWIPAAHEIEQINRRLRRAAK